MNEKKLAHLLSRRIPTTEMDKLQLARRISSEKIFTSVDECFDYLNHIVENKSINPDDLFFISYKDKPLLVMNIVDEAVCTIIYEVMQQKYNDDPGFIGYIRVLIDNFYDKILNIADKIPYSQIEYRYYKQLEDMMICLKYLATPDTHFKEESSPKQLARTYYGLMHEMAKNARPYNEYFRKLQNYYYNLYTREII